MKKDVVRTPFITFLAVIIAGFVHKLFGIKVDVGMVEGSLVVVGTYIVSQLAEDWQKIKNGQLPSGFNCIKFVAMLIACIAIGTANYLSNYYGFHFSQEQIVLWAGIAVTLILGKTTREIASTKAAKKGEIKDAAPIDTEHFGDHGPAV